MRRRIVYLKSARVDLQWFRLYYGRVFREGASRARQHFRSAVAMLLDNPEVGRPAEFPGVRELPVARTPFAIFYRLTDRQIEILRIWDVRADPNDLQLW